MHWYEALIQYFPPAEMRPQEHFTWLIANRPDIYRVQAPADHVLLTLDYPEVIFIDYFYVYPDYRGQGVGTRALRGLKATGKVVLLEVEPASPADPDSVRRRRLYEREGFRYATSVAFRLPAPLTGACTELDLLYWAPGEVDEGRIYQWMRQMYQDLYAAIDPGIYGRPYPPVADVLTRRFSS